LEDLERFTWTGVRVQNLIRSLVKVRKYYSTNVL
jgi:hypothetical protein